MSNYDVNKVATRVFCVHHKTK